MMLSGAIRSVGESCLAKVPGNDNTEVPCSKGAVWLDGALRSGAGCSGTGITCWLRGVAIGGNLGTPTARPEVAAVGTGTGIGGVCASRDDECSASTGSTRTTSMGNIL